jgi:hypothetical protein
MEKSTVCIDDLARGEEEERGKERESYHTWRFYHMVMPQASNTSDRTAMVPLLYS